MTPAGKVDRGTQTLAHVDIPLHVPLFLPSGRAQAGSPPCQEAPSLFTVSPSKHMKVRHGLHRLHRLHRPTQRWQSLMLMNGGAHDPQKIIM